MTDQLAAIREYHSLMPEGALCECGQMEDACDVRFVLHLLDEAAAAERERLRKEVAALPKWDKRSVPGGFHVNRAAVLALLADPEAPTDE